MDQGFSMTRPSSGWRFTHWLLTAGLASLAGCGGGGGGGDTSTVVSYNVQAAFKNLSAAPRSYSLAGTATNGAALTLTWTITPIGASVFPLTNSVSQRVDSSIVIRSATTELVNGSQQSHFTAAQEGLGSVRADGSCSQSDNLPMPTAALLNAVGKLGDSTVYATCSTRAPVINRIAGDWLLQAFGPKVFLCVNTQLLNAAGTSTVSRETDCIEIAPDGTVGSQARLTLDVGGTTLVFTN